MALSCVVVVVTSWILHNLILSVLYELVTNTAFR
jgi:hypothetical protein